MKYGVFFLLFFLIFDSAALAETGPGHPKGVVLLHGLARSASSMKKMEKALQAAGYQTLNIDYPSTSHPVEVLCRDHVAPKVNAFSKATGGSLAFVTHSMGGIVLRYLVKEGLIETPHSAVMLSPPNQGSETVDKLGGLRLFKLINGPAGNQLGTGPDQLPATLGPVTFPLGILTGTRTINFILSALIPGPDDGKVAVARAPVAGMADFRAIPATHPFIMKNRTAIEETLGFLEKGRFSE
ncbi:esterase/lipase family protein [Desulfoluna spongiiphila]|uniref:Alpha/beta hydrolase family protein n=1 Tax=Desulfoluna spongiiphila TaxID=419481 RepID=A0A1G5E8Z2_9BACT|nr:alpha/beta fold hydrolase [Desulfoluna spongiiphila]SCY23221.1 Alpha/beta hydrolase family protein [Desulfoluna spongiiphila]VVS91652.1 alpha/beta hydrolase fold [Desulfoluna spongiiphila]